MTDAELRAHIKAPVAEHGHEQPADDVDRAAIEELRSWHDGWEHAPPWTRADHAHDEFSARRYGVPLVA